MVTNLQKLFEDFIHESRFVKRRRPDTIRGYEAAFGTLNKLMPNMTAESLTPELFSRFCEILQTRVRTVGRDTVKQGVKDSTIAAYQRKLNTFFIWLANNGHIARNPLDHVARVRPRYEDIKMLRRPEIDKIRAAVENHSYNLLQTKRDRAIISVLLFCGLRRGELLGLQVTDLDMERMTLTVRAAASKSKYARKLPLNAQTYLHLEDYLHERNRQRRYTTPSLFVAINQDQGLTSGGLKSWVQRLRDLSRVKFHLHQFRHTFASNLAAKGMNAIQIQKLMGHSDLRMMQAYVRSLGTDDLRPVVAALTFDNLA
jgi:site-specific recombinase XerD